MLTFDCHFSSLSRKSVRHTKLISSKCVHAWPSALIWFHTQSNHIDMSFPIGGLQYIDLYGQFHRKWTFCHASNTNKMSWYFYGWRDSMKCLPFLAIEHSWKNFTKYLNIFAGEVYCSICVTTSSRAGPDHLKSLFSAILVQHTSVISAINQQPRPCRLEQNTAAELLLYILSPFFNGLIFLEISHSMYEPLDNAGLLDHGWSALELGT